MGSCRISIRKIILPFLAAVMLLLAFAPVSGSASHTARADEDTVAAVGKTGFVKKKGNWYYYLNGKKQKGWITVGSNTYFARKKGKQKYQLVQGWKKIKKKWYYFLEKGKMGRICSMVKGRTLKVNGISCVFNKDGSFQKCKYAGKKNGFVQKIGEMARENQARNNILASIVTAQACLETGYGRHVYHNNLFGIRARRGYRHYSSWKESMEDYTDFMKQYIPSLFGVRNAYRACSIVGSSGYAQAWNYGSMLSTIVDSHNLKRFNK